MDSDRFDGFVRIFGQTRTRRQTLRGLAGVLAVGGPALAVPEAAAVRCSASNPCPECYRCRRRRCRKRADEYPCSGGTCQDGTCEACLALKARCTNAEQCCQDGGTVACAPTGNLGQNQCCRPLGAPCSTPGRFEECCAVVFEGGGGDLVFCGANHTCGGPGAQCHSSSGCASGVCCGFDFGVCCGAGQQCNGFECVG